MVRSLVGATSGEWLLKQLLTKTILKQLLTKTLKNTCKSTQVLHSASGEPWLLALFADIEAYDP
jgi:hypothetical protein